MIPLRTALLALLLAALPAALGAQAVDTVPPAAPPVADAPAPDPLPPPVTPAGAPGARGGEGPVRVLATVGGAYEERWRDAQLREGAPAAGFLLRSPSAMTPRASRPSAAVLAPEAAFAWNSRIPYSVNDGAAWAGRGASAVVMTGVMVDAGPLRLIAAPELVWAQNRAFDGLLPTSWTDAQRAEFIPPFQAGAHSIDLPLRFGDEGWTRIRPGQSSLALHAGPVAVGAATESQWWGPGVHTAVVMSNQAEGVPHLFLRTDRPLRTPLGAVEARWMIGALEPTPYLDATGDDGWRSLSAGALVLHPARTLAVGVSRAVYAPVDGRADALGRAADVLTRWRGAGDTLAARPYEQIVSLFGRWVLPDDGAEVYAEWARHRLPGSPRDLLASPEHSQGFVLGARWIRPLGPGAVRLHAEVASLEKSATHRWRDVGSYYASRVVPHGYTHRGQPVGAAIGPGASGQWAAADWVRGEGRAGLFVGRIRWATDAYYDNPATPRIVYQGQNQPQSRSRGYDVSVVGGLRGAVPAGPLRVEAEWTVARRYNYLFQNYSRNWSERDLTVNVTNHTLRLNVSARLP